VEKWVAITDAGIGHWTWRVEGHQHREVAQGIRDRGSLWERCMTGLTVATEAMPTATGLLEKEVKNSVGS
jgi:hypothetical protein